MEEIEHGNKKASSPSFLIILIEGGMEKVDKTKQTRISHRTNTGKKSY
jgi:hypothetical protein